MTRTLGLALSSLLALVATATAQRSPDMATLDRGDGISKLGLDVGLTFLDHPPYDAALRLEPYGQLILQSGLGFYGALPISVSFGGDGNPEPLPEDATALGNLDLGLLYVVTAGPEVSFVLRGGLALPTASDGLDATATSYYASFPRMTDLALAYPDAWYLRLGVSPLIYLDRVFLRADLGVDIGLDDEGADELLRLNVGAGVDLGPVALSLELANTANLDRFDFDDGDDRWGHTFAATMRFMGETLQPFLAIGAPIDDDFRDRVDLFLAAGFQAAF